MVLVINAPSPAASKNHATDQRQSCKGCLKPCTSTAIMPAAEGVGMHITYFDPPGVMPYTLNRASLHAQQIRNAKQQTQANSPTCWNATLPSPGKPRSPQAYANIAGAIPKLTTSARESNCTPKSVFAFSSLARRPSSESNKIAKPMALAARSK